MIIFNRKIRNYSHHLWSFQCNSNFCIILESIQFFVYGKYKRQKLIDFYFLQYTSISIYYIFQLSWRNKTRRQLTMPCSKNYKKSLRKCQMTQCCTSQTLWSITDSSKKNYKKFKAILWRKIKDLVNWSSLWLDQSSTFLNCLGGSQAQLWNWCKNWVLACIRTWEKSA